MNRTVIFSASVVILAGCAAAAACRHEPAVTKPPTPVRVLAAAPVPPSGGLRYSATIQPREQVDLAFKSGGYVREIRRVEGVDGRLRAIQQGDSVARGTVLAQVRETDYVQKVSQAKASLAEAEAAAERARLDFERAEKLLAANSMTRPEWESSRANAYTGKAKVEAAKASLDSAETALEDASLKSPMDGVVLSRSVEQGTLVNAGTVGFVVADMSSVKAVFGVPDRVVTALKLGETLTVTTEAAPGKPFQGVLTALSPAADRKSRVFDVEVTIPNGEGTLRAGLIAAIEIWPDSHGLSARQANLPAIPLSAVIQSPRSSDAYAVFVVAEDGKSALAKSREVKLGPITGNLVTIVDGLKAGERVVVSGASLLAENQAVLIVP
ncbi:MAG TPA: efflux RND transporter periplasmic adaptor subunit [Thermoanaerobaculia bacterium]|nr:efflux RND transporter periplasmic adaptor subunit [Thermoanaerobaculia bacterium]